MGRPRPMGSPSSEVTGGATGLSVSRRRRGGGTRGPPPRWVIPAQALRSTYGQEASYSRCGGSIKSNIHTCRRGVAIKMVQAMRHG